MVIKQISVILKDTINIGNYESVSPAVGAVADLEEGDDYSSCMEELTSVVKEYWTKEVVRNMELLLESRDSVSEDVLRRLEQFKNEIK